MPYARINDPNLWRERAKEARALAEMIADPEAKQQLLSVAESYDEMAKRAEGRSLTRKP